MRAKLEMDRQRWLAVSPYLDQALELPAAQRETWLREIENSAPDVVADVRRLLAAAVDDTYRSFLNNQAVPANTQQFQSGELLGSYRVLRELGRGGMAVVYLAQRADGLFEQHVALKLLRFETETGEARRHFAQERQILASLNHPAIARLIDGGIALSGQHYLVMEYVEGVALDRYCDTHELSVADRLKLFVQVADAVQYAHRHLIVHRDLKPSNIVVDAERKVKLLDFGIAKLLKPDLFPHAAPVTRDVIRLMTPEYASPEQARGEPITTATDVYQLGVLLYELLTGRAPYQLRGCSHVESLRIICETEPTRPSTACADKTPAAEARSTTPERLRRLLRGDLEAIVLKALRKEPERRYGSVDALRDDVLRYLQGRPVSAYKGMWTYQIAKFARRHAASVVISTFALCVLAVVIMWYTLRVADERDKAASEALRARREAETAHQVSSFLTTVLRGSSSRITHGNTTARTLLDRGAEKIEKQLALQPHVQGRLLNVIGDAYVQYDIQDQAQPLLERALIQNTKLFGPMSLEVSDSKMALGKLALNRGELQKAERLLEEALAIRERILGPKHLATADTLSDLAYTLQRRGEFKKSVQSAERAVKIYNQSPDADPEVTFSVMATYAATLKRAGEATRARELLEQQIPRIEHTLGPMNERLSVALGTLASVKLTLNDLEGIEPLLLRAIAINEQLFGPQYTSNSIYRINLAILYCETSRFREARAIVEQVIAIHSQQKGRPSHEFEATARSMRGYLLQVRGDLQSALKQMQIAQHLFAETLGKSHWRYGTQLWELGLLEMERGEFMPAAAHLDEALTNVRSAEPTELAMALSAQGQLLARTEKSSQCETRVRQAIEICRQAFPHNRMRIFVARGALGECLLSQGKLSEAEILLRDSIQQLGTQYPIHRRLYFGSLIRLYQLKGDQASAQRTAADLAAFSSKLRE